MAEEKRFENKIKNYLKDNNYWHIKYWGGAKYTTNGVPDILTCINGYFVGIEVKASKGRPSALQLWQIKCIRRGGGIGIVLYPSQWDKFTELCKCLKAGMWSDAETIMLEIDEKLSQKDKEVLYE